MAHMKHESIILGSQLGGTKVYFDENDILGKFPILVSNSELPSVSKRNGLPYKWRYIGRLPNTQYRGKFTFFSLELFGRHLEDIEYNRNNSRVKRVTIPPRDRYEIVGYHNMIKSIKENLTKVEIHIRDYEVKKMAEEMRKRMEKGGSLFS